MSNSKPMIQVGCLICGQDLIYQTQSISRACDWCGTLAETDCWCSSGHFICNTCHSQPARDVIRLACLQSTEPDPLQLANRIMQHSSLHMHGPEHHFLVPAVLLTAVAIQRNQQRELETWLSVARDRSAAITGGFCGLYGTCGAAVGTGLALSIITGNTPLKTETWALCQEQTAHALQAIASAGGPRCCKRDSFFAIRSAVRFLNDRLQLSLPESDMQCSFSELNRECLMNGCPFFATRDQLPEPGVF